LSKLNFPSHSTVAAYLALFGVVAGGSAYAATTIGSDDIKTDAVLAKHIKADQVKASEIAGNSKSFQAVAHVRRQADAQGTGFLDDTGIKEKGFDSVRSEGTGSYCLVPSGNLKPSKNPPIITAEFGSSSTENHTTAWDVLGSHACEAGEYDVQTFDADTGANIDTASFVIMVP